MTARRSDRADAEGDGPWPARLCLAGLAGIILSFPFGSPWSGSLTLLFFLPMILGVLWTRVTGRQAFRHLPWMLAFAVLSVVSAWNSDFRERSFDRLENGLLLLIVFPAAQLVGRSPSGRMGLSRVASIAIALAGLDLATQRLFGRSLLLGLPHASGDRIAGSLPNPNDIGFVVALAALAGTASGRGRLAFRWLGWIAAALSAALSGSRNAMAGLAATAWSLVLFGRVMTARSLIVRSSIVVGIAMVLDLGGVRGRILDTLAFVEIARFEAMRVAWETFLDRPWLGAGPCVFHEIFQRAKVTHADFPSELRPIGMPWVHNIPLEMLAERGILGTVLLLALIGLATRDLRRALRRGIGVEWNAAVAAGLVGFAGMAIFDLTLLKDWCSTVLWMLCGLASVATTVDGGEGKGGPEVRSRPRRTPATTSRT